MEMHTEVNHYSCINCNLFFKMNKDLKTHMNKHGGKKTHCCKKCSYTSIKASNLKLHNLFHSGKTPIVCKQCNYSCIRGDHLKQHMRIHTGEKPFVCKQCKYSCTRSGSLKVHMLSHSREQLGEPSEKKFGQTWDFVPTRGRGSRPIPTLAEIFFGRLPIFSCTQCNFSFTTAADLKRHARETFCLRAPQLFLHKSQ